jgi:hypothetical protein
MVDVRVMGLPVTVDVIVSVSSALLVLVLVAVFVALPAATNRLAAIKIPAMIIAEAMLE